MRLDRLTALASAGAYASTWYTEAEAEIGVICALEGWRAERFAAVLAVTSPRVNIRRNVRQTLRLMSGQGWFSSTLGSTRLAYANWRRTGRIRGQKTEAFRRALLGDLGAVVLDVWMARALRVDQRHFDRIGDRARAVRAVERVADRLGLAPRDCQACLWAGAFQAEEGKRAPFFPLLDEWRRWVALGRRYPDGGAIDRYERQFAAV